MVGFDRFTHYHYIQVDAESLSSKALLHTMFHILGRYHEHERADRDQYVNIIKKNVIGGILLTHTLYMYIYLYVQYIFMYMYMYTYTFINIHPWYSGEHHKLNVNFGYFRQ